jgi:hypothetical protein
MSLLSSAFFVRYLRGRPRFEVSYSTRDLCYFKMWGSQPALIVRRDQVQRLEIEEQVFLDEGTRVANFYISLITHEGDQHALCVSTDEHLIRSLHDELEKLLGGRS